MNPSFSLYEEQKIKLVDEKKKKKKHKRKKNKKSKLEG